MDIEEALNEFRAEYESSEHWGSDLIISLECAEVISAELDKKDKIINEIAEYINKLDIDDEICSKNTINPEYCNEDYTNCKKCIIEYFTNKVEEDK